MFLTYLRRELRRRSKQAIVVAIGLAVGIGLVITVSATSAGVTTAQTQVLHSLYGVGTDMTVTKTATPGTGGGQRFGGFGAGGATAGTHVARTTLRASPGTTTLPETEVTSVGSLKGASAAVGGLVLSDTAFSGTLPSGSGGTGSAAPRGGAAGANFTISSFTVDGVQLTSSGVGPISSADVSQGSYFSSSDATASVAVVSASYAKTNNLAVGSTVTVAGSAERVIGIATLPTGAADVYLPLGTAQKLASMTGKVTDIFVSASSATSVSSLTSEVKSLVPSATVATSASLAKDVSGSLSSASSLASNLGTWLSVAALVVAVLLAGLLMMGAVSRRVREFGTLKAIGWRSRRVVGQVMGEGLALGLLGGVAGIVLGVGGAAIVSAISPTLSATVGPTALTGGGFAGGGGAFARAGGNGVRQAASAAHTVLVHLTAPLQGSTIALAVALAVVGGLVAGAFGAWRAARLRPAAALRRVE